MILQYFTALLNIGKLNKTETLELARPLVNSGRANLLYNWI